MAEADLSRRHFLNVAVNAVGAGITAILAVPLTGYFLDPALRTTVGTKNWVKIGSKGELGADPKEFAFQTVRSEGFMKQSVSAKAYAYVDDKGAPVAFSNICTHLGCPAGWQEDEGLFLCPCHGGKYDKTGKNIGGPPPRPLPVYEAKFEGDDLLISV